MTTLEEIKTLLEKLQGGIPLNYQLWDADQAADYLNVPRRQFTERIALHPTFPKPIRLPSEKGMGAKRWKAREVIKYTEDL